MEVERPPALEQTLAALGRNVKSLPDGPIQLDPAGVVWIQSNANWFPKIFRQLMACPPRTRPLVVHWFSEPLPPPRAAGLPRPSLHLKEVAKILMRDTRTTDVYSNAARLRSLVRSELLDLLVVSTPARRQYLAEQGIAAHYVPLGYNRSQFGHDLGLERTRDVIFLGAMVPRRLKVLKRLERAGIHIEQLGSWFDPACWGESRTRFLNQTKIFLNIARYPGELPGARLILGMANKCLVVSEPIYDSGPYVPGEHFVVCSIDEMPDLIRYYLAHPEARQKIIDAGHRLVTETVTLERSIKQILCLADEKIRQRAKTSENAS
ncbi:MAG TPA: glycosyltransferase [Xanthomonadales bacterium]|nr:glycosyltransferase [Xanthomonadales bacterium]